MKIQVYTENQKAEQICFLALKQNMDSVKLFVVDEQGNKISGGNLLNIEKEGVYYYPGVDPKLGFNLTNGRLAMANIKD